VRSFISTEVISFESGYEQKRKVDNISSKQVAEHLSKISKRSQVSRSAYQIEDKQSKVRKDRSSIFREQMDIDPSFQAEDQNELQI
jgi:hypothetical protein